VDGNIDLKTDEEISMWIIDECDFLLSNLKFVCTRDRFGYTKNLGGLLQPLNNRARTYFISATFSKPSLAILKEVFDSEPVLFETMF
jgi:hypothetical protein